MGPHIRDIVGYFKSVLGSEEGMGPYLVSRDLKYGPLFCRLFVILLY